MIIYQDHKFYMKNNGIIKFFVKKIIYNTMSLKVT